MPSVPHLIGSYTAPAWKIGQRVYCRLRLECNVTSYTDAPIPWPRGRTANGGVSLVVIETLKRAIITESVAALVHWFGVSQGTAWKWRKLLGVSRAGTPGSAALLAAAARPTSRRVLGVRDKRRRQ